MAVEYLTTYIPNQNDIAYAKLVAEWTKEAKTMLPKTELELLGLFAMGRSVLLLGLQGEPVAHAAVTFAWPDNWYELGGVVVDEQIRGRGVGHQIVNELDRHVATNLAIKKRMALCNRGSLPLFMSAGGQILDDPKMLPKEIWSACASCPTKPEPGKGLCCDTPVIMKNTYAVT